MGGCSSEHGQVWTVPLIDLLIYWPWSQQAPVKATVGRILLVHESSHDGVSRR